MFRITLTINRELIGCAPLKRSTAYELPVDG